MSKKTPGIHLRNSALDLVPSAWLPYLAPYLSFLVIVQIKSVVPSAVRDWILLPQILVPGLLLLYYLRRGAYPELPRARFSVVGPLTDVMVGVGIGLIWMAPYVLGWLDHPTTLVEDRLSAVALGLRFTGFVLITPFIEELFVRSALLRYVAGMRTKADFRKMPLARFEWPGFVATVLYFTFSHVSWEWPVAFLTGIIFNVWLYYRGNIGATIRAHAAANAVIYLSVVFSDAVDLGMDLDLWFFL